MRSRFCVGVLIALLAIQVATRARGDDLAVGFATVDITPPRGYRMAGYFHERANTGTRDPLLAKAIVFRQGDRQAALVFCDLIGLTADVSRRARNRIQERTAIPSENVAVCATHSHTGPLYFGVLRRHFHEKALAAHGSDPREEVDYPAVLVDSLANAVSRAAADLAPARLATGVARQDGLSFNRRFHMKDGKVVFNPGQRNPAIVRPAGPIDPDIGLVAVFKPEQEQPKAVLSVFALHLDTVGGTEYSADYPYFVERALRQSFGARFASLFGAGTCGDINHIDVTVQGRRTAEEIGSALARTIQAAIPKLETIAKPALATARTVVEVPLQRYSAAETAQARANLDRVGSPDFPFLEAVHTVTVVDLAQNHPSGTIGLEVQVIRLSHDTAIVTLPGEVFVELGLAIKRASPFHTTLVVELANDTPAYIPTQKAFGEGSYEIVNSRVAPGGGELMSEAAVRLLKDLAR
jgi:hypothetical protein